jgi:ribosomal-protein-alanine N-acetyltransferase
MWGVYPKDTDVLIGTCSLHSIDKVHGTGETGYMIGERERWGTSAGLEAMSLMMRFAFESLGLRRLVGGTYAKHHATNFNHKRLGYVCEGRLRKHHYWAPGVFVDVFRWGILAEEWEKRKDLES